MGVNLRQLFEVFKAGFNVPKGKWQIDGVPVTASAADLNEGAGGAAFAAVVAAAGNSQGTAAVLTAKRNVITGADGTKGVKLPLGTVGDTFHVVNSNATNGLKVYPSTGAQINALGANVAFILAPGREASLEVTSATQLYVAGEAAFASVQGVAAGYKVARGEHVQVAASDTIVSGLTSVVAVIVSPRTRTLKQLFFNGSPGDQAGAPVAGSFLLTSQKPTAANDVTPIAATDFTDNIVVDWVAIGT